MYPPFHFTIKQDYDNDLEIRDYFNIIVLGI